MIRYNPSARTWVGPPGDGAVAGFHRGLPGYVPTPLVEIPRLAREMGVGRVFVKDESARLGLPAFKILGVSYATARALAEHLGSPGERITPDDLRSELAGQPSVTLVTATDGNHGRALARTAAGLGLPARVFVPDVLRDETVAAIRGEGARVTVVAGDYDAAVRAAADAAGADPAALLIQDTAWPGYERIPQWIVDGYATLFHEIDDQLATAGAGDADLVSVPVGVGSLAQAAVAHYRRPPRGTFTVVLGVEPDTAACVRTSLDAGTLTSIATGATVMNGLNCGTPSSLAWPVLRGGLDAIVAVSDGAAARAVGDLGRLGISSGASGAAALAGVRRLLATDRSWGDTSEPFDPAIATVVLLSTEGVLAGEPAPADPPAPRPSGQPPHRDQRPGGGMTAVTR